MLSKLTIKNYALIESLSISFSDGFTTITGETGAGKSILLGGLSLVLGKRADLGSLRNKEQKCIIEAEFEIVNYKLSSFFKTHDLDYDAHTILRREILPSGKSRAFINDSPVTLSVLSALGDALIDIHSQHQTLQLTEQEFQLKVIDALANNTSALASYRTLLQSYKKVQKELADLQQFQATATKEHDYYSFLLGELEQVTLKPGSIETLEEEYEALNNVETILEHLAGGQQLLGAEDIGVVAMLTELKGIASKLAPFGPAYKELQERIQSVFIEIDDIQGEWQVLEEGVDADPEVLGQIQSKLQVLYDLLKKHNVTTIEELITIKEQLSSSVQATENIEADIEQKAKEVHAVLGDLDKAAKTIRTNRITVLSSLKKQLHENLAQLGMPSARFNIDIAEGKEFTSFGKDELLFVFSANKGMDFGPLKKVASGGELSRIMLTIKSILAKYEQLPTMIFDEIDTGVSGEISGKMGDIMERMSDRMQVFSITHLPQVAAKGVQQLKVYKEDIAEITHTGIKKLSEAERVTELAEMLGGKDITDSALAHAKQLLN